MQIEEKIALVTGGANGIGFAYAKELLRNGAANVAILDLANANGDDAVSKLNTEFGQGKAIFIICDVTKPKELEAGFERTVKEFGGLDIVINNAGIMDDSRWELEVNVNYNAVVRGTLLGVKHMGKENGGEGGTIVNVSSTLGILPNSHFPVYIGTKHAVVGFTRSFGHHYEKTGVRILTMCPSLTDTELISKTPERALDIISPELVIAVNTTYPSQTVDSVANGMMHILRFGENGSVWVVEGGKPAYEIEVPNQIVKKVAG